MLAGLVLAGCSTVSDLYIPQTVGPADGSEPYNGLEVTISPSRDRITIGEPIHFNVYLKNVSSQAFWVPREPDIIFMWIYPNGKRDSFVVECRDNVFYGSDQAVLLKPGQSLRTETVIRTYYFARHGITEFQAICNAGRNTNPALQPSWHGKVLSNTYGVRVDKSDERGRFSGSRLTRRDDKGRS